MAHVIPPLNENMTIEEYMDNLVSRHQASIKEKCSTIQNKLDSEVAASAERLMKRHREVLASIGGNTNIVSADGGSSASKEKNASTETNSEMATKETKPKVLSGLFVEVISGPHKGSTFELHPRVRAPCFVGRSQGKKFLERGISLSEDWEVSTTHGKFSNKKGTLYYTDNGSTNGSYLADKQLEVGDDLELTDGIVIGLGGFSELRVALMYS